MNQLSKGLPSAGPEADGPDAGSAAASSDRGGDVSGARDTTYYPRLDGLRAVAVALVFVEHFVFNDFVRELHLGGVGVKLFFVLSGFLITSILLDTKSQGMPLAKAAQRFYWRRTLRLMPAFYCAIALTAALGIAEMREHWWLHAAYLSNVLVLLEGRWVGGGHFWTLAAEEQFYLLWFPVVILLPRRWLPTVLVGCLLLAPVYRSAIAFGATPFIDALLPGQIDSLATGGLLAWMRHEGVWGRLEGAVLSRWVLWSAAALVGLLSVPLGWGPVLSWVVLPVFINLAALAAVRQSMSPRRDVVLDVLAWPVMRRIGKISYGLYIYHYFLPAATTAFIPALATPEGAGMKALRLVVWIAGTYVLAELSWRLVERPFLRLKDRGGRRRAVPAGSGAAGP